MTNILGIDPDHSHIEILRYSVGATNVTCQQISSKTIVCLVSELDSLRLATKRNDR